MASTTDKPQAGTVDDRLDDLERRVTVLEVDLTLMLKALREPEVAGAVKVWPKREFGDG
jgi:hypothetical protein